MKHALIFFAIVFFFPNFKILSQELLLEKNTYNRQDTLRGSITKERSWWDLNYYHLDIAVDPIKKTIVGSNTVVYTVLNENNLMQIDLQEPMVLSAAIQDGDSLDIIHEGNAHFIRLKKPQIKNHQNSIKLLYKGQPREAVRAPWDGGISWTKDNNGKDFIASSCQGLGASVWWPNKDHMYDEVDSMKISVNVPKHLMNVSNGRLIEVNDETDNTKTYHWFVSNPINNYGVNINIGDYVNFSEIYKGEKGNLDMDYYVLSYNLEKAKKHFRDAPKMMEAFEHWFGPYPFYEDSFKIVEAPYLGMEHQSSITYGNDYKKGYLGRDLSNTGWGLKFDYIIIHEAGHEWFANNITYKDIADMWIHEGFTAYSENLFIDYHYGKEAAAAYVIGTRRGIRNTKPIIGVYDVNKEGSRDMYSKGANLLHTIRQIVNNDEKWRSLLRKLNSNFYHQTVTTAEIETFISQFLGIDLQLVFDQYLRDIRIPVLEYYFSENQLHYRWNNVIKNFNMPIRVNLDSKNQFLNPNTNWQSIQIQSTANKTTFGIDVNFYVKSAQIISTE